MKMQPKRELTEVTIFNMHVSLLIFISFAMLSVAVTKAEATRAADLAAAKAKDEKEAFSSLATVMIQVMPTMLNQFPSK